MTIVRRIMRLLYVIVFGATILISSPSFAQEKQEGLYMIYEKCMNACYTERFDEALRLASKIRNEYPEEPAGVLGLLQAYQTISQNYRVRTNESKIDSLLDLSVGLAKNALKRNRKDGRSYFYVGTAYGFRCVFNAQQGKWIEAFRDGSQIERNFNKAVRYSPDFYDAYYGIGLYKYWLAAKGAMRYLPFSKKKREEGMQQMNISVEKGRFLKTNAMYGLLAVYYNEKQYEDALELSNRLYQMYPRNPTLNYRRGHILQKLEHWQEALVAFRNLKAILEETPYQSTSYKIECTYEMAVCNHKMGNILEAQRLCQNALALEQKLDFSKEIDGQLAKFSDIQESLHDLSEDLNAVAVSDASGGK